MTELITDIEKSSSSSQTANEQHSSSLRGTKQSQQLASPEQGRRVPQLRFKEFDGDWEILKLKDVAKIERGRFSPRPRNNPIYYNGNIPFVQTSDVVNANGKIEIYTQTLNEKGLAVSKLFPAGTILITIAANIGHVGVLQIDMACPDSLIGIKPNDKTHNYFLNYYLATHQEKMDYLAPEGAQKNINIEFLNPYKVPSTSLPEQQKIASFLSAVDEKIQQLSKKKALLEQYKKGVMQQLFPSTGSGQRSGKLRFKPDTSTPLSARNGKDYPDWEEKRLGEIATFLKGKGISKADLSDEGNLECIRYGELYTVYGETIIDVFSKTNVPEKELVLSKKDDVIIPASGETQIDIATASCVRNPNIAIGGDLNIIRSANDGVFLAYYLNSALKLDIARLSQGISVVHLYSSQLKTLKISVPVIEEQQKIASYLSSIDSKIESVASARSATEQFKKGLLQQMFV